MSPYSPVCVHSWMSLVIVLKWPGCTWSEWVHSGLALARLLWPVMTSCDHARPCYIHLWPICDQTRPDAARCDQVWLCMHGGRICVWFAGMSVKNNQNSCFFLIKSVLKGVYHVIITCHHCLCMGSISVTDWLQQTIWGDISQSQTHSQQHLITSWNGLEVTYIYKQPGNAT